jgi:Zn-dependent metalloprotease
LVLIFFTNITIEQDMKNIPSCPFCCHIIPDIVIKELKKKGYDVPTNQSKKEDEDFRLERATFMTSGRGLMAASSNNGQRLVYDSQTQAKKKFKLVRKDGDKPVADVDVNAAYDNAGIVKSFFKEVLAWDSIDGEALDIICNVHYLTRYNNAFWDGEQMTFGDGDGVNFSGFARSLDVTGHELTHGIVQYVSGLVYKGQSGALNEHYADVFGTAVKQWSLKQDAKTADWLIGDTCMIGSFKGKAIRSMKDPADTKVVMMAQPDSMDKIYKGTSDNGGVHINSGIPNKAFYLVSMDIGTQTAAIIWFDALKSLRPTAKFPNFYKALTISATKLITDKKIPVTTLVSLEKAFKTVGIAK